MSGGLHWTRNSESDFATYQLHRGGDADFTPGPETLIASQIDTGFVDTHGTMAAFYKLAAVDVHGNMSAYALASVGMPVSTAARSPLSFMIEGLAPNPASGSTLSIFFSTPSAGTVEVEVIDLAGRRIRAWSPGVLTAGSHSLSLQDLSGLRTGIHFVMLRQNGRSVVAKFAIAR